MICAPLRMAPINENLLLLPHPASRIPTTPMPEAASRKNTPTLKSSTSAPLLKGMHEDRKSTRLNSSHANISYAVFCLKKTQPNPLSTSVNAPEIHDSLLLLLARLGPPQCAPFVRRLHRLPPAPLPEPLPGCTDGPHLP